MLERVLRFAMATRAAWFALLCLGMVFLPSCGQSGRPPNTCVSPCGYLEPLDLRAPVLSPNPVNAKVGEPQEIVATLEGDSATFSFYDWGATNFGVLRVVDA